MEHVAHTHFPLKEVAESTAAVALAIGEEESAVDHVLFRTFAGQEHSLHHIADIDKGDFLGAIAHSEIHMLLDALCHQVVVTLTRAIDPRRAQDDPRHFFLLLQPLLCLPLALAVMGVGLRGIGVTDGAVVLLANSTEDAEGTEEDKATGNHPFLNQSVDKVACTLKIRAIEVTRVTGLGGTCRMDDIVPTASHLFLHGRELQMQLFRRTQVQIQEIDTLVHDVLQVARSPDASPHLVAAIQRFAHYKTSDEARGSSNEYTHRSFH